MSEVPQSYTLLEFGRNDRVQRRLRVKGEDWNRDFDFPASNADFESLKD